MTETAGIVALVLAAGAGTYLWRALGVALSGRINPAGAIFTWVGCVAYAMIAGLVSRLILIPGGTLAGSALEHRLLACAAGLAAYYLAKRNLFLGVGVGVAALMALTAGGR